MTCEVHKSGEICIVKLAGELSFGEATELLRRKSAELVDAGERLFLLDLLEVRWLDSSALGEVVEFHKRARAQRGVVKLVLNPHSRSQFTVTHLEKMFDIFEDVDSGVASFAGPDGVYREKF